MTKSPDALVQRSISALAVYEPSYIVEGSRPVPAADLYQRLCRLVVDGRRDEAVTLFQTEAVGLPAAIVEQMRGSPSIRATARALADAIPGARHRSLPGQNHGVLHHPEALHEPLVAFLPPFSTRRAAQVVPGASRAELADSSEGPRGHRRHGRAQGGGPAEAILADPGGGFAVGGRHVIAPGSVRRRRTSRHTRR